MSSSSRPPHKRRPRTAKLRPSKRIREKIVETKKGFDYEIKLVTLDQTAIGAYGLNSATPAGAAAKADMQEALSTLREMAGGRFKIVRHESIRQVRTTILLERYADVVLFTMLASGLIYRVYKLVSATASNRPPAVHPV